jgi:hypothetical protein
MSGNVAFITGGGKIFTVAAKSTMFGPNPLIL